MERLTADVRRVGDSLHGRKGVHPQRHPYCICGQPGLMHHGIDMYVCPTSGAPLESSCGCNPRACPFVGPTEDYIKRWNAGEDLSRLLERLAASTRRSG